MKWRIQLAVSCLFLGVAFADVMTWTKNTNFDDPANWNGGGISCSNDRKKFPKDLVASIYIQKNESLQELILSDNMVLSVGEGVILSFNSQLLNTDNTAKPTTVQQGQGSSVSEQTTPATAACTDTGRVVEFSAKPASWFDPESWSTQLTSDDSQRFTLDLQSIPCSQDRVIFPSKNTFLADLEQTNIRAGAMLIHSQEFRSQTAFNSYWEGNDAPYEFVGRPSDTPTISGQICGEDKTCPCKDRYTDEMKALVCKYKTCDTKAACSKPIEPSYGQCCSLCGSKLMISTTSAEMNPMMYRLHTEIISGLQNYPDVRYSIGPQINSTMEIILTDQDDEMTGDSANAAVCDLRKLLLKNETAQAIGIFDISFVRSDGVDNCNPKPGTTLPNIKPPSEKWDTVIICVSLAFVVVCIFFVFLGIYLYRKRYAAPGKTELELGNVNRTSQGFDNPVYDDPLPFEDSFIVRYDTEGDQVNGFENAVYSAGTDSAVSGPTEEKKKPLEDPYAPVVKKSKKKKQKEAKNVGFDNPVYALDGEQKDGTGSMVSVPLDEDDNQLPAYVEHDGTGYANPIATGLSEEMMAPSLPKKQPITTLKANEGFDNPLFSGGEQNNGVEQVSSDLGEITVHVSEPTKKKKKGKGSKSKSKGEEASKEQGFGNPMYGHTEDSQEFYQPETPGEENSKPADDEGL